MWVHQNSFTTAYTERSTRWTSCTTATITSTMHRADRSHLQVCTRVCVTRHTDLLTRAALALMRCAFAAGSGTFLEHVLLTAVMALPLVGVMAAGVGSLALFYVYVLGFDFMRFMIHSNVEVVPLWPFRSFPFLRFLMITPS